MSENPAGLNQAAMQALGAGDFATAQALLQRLVAADPASIPGWLNLAAVRRRLNDVDGAFDALREVMRRDPRNFPALLMSATLMERQGDIKGAAGLYGAALSNAPPDNYLDRPTQQAVAHAREVHGRHTREMSDFIRARIGDAQSQCASVERRRLDSFIDMTLRVRKRYQQEPLEYFYPGLPAIEFYEREEFPWLADLEAATVPMQQELATILREDQAGFAPYIHYEDHMPLDQWRELNHSPRWSAFHFYEKGQPVAERCRRAPATMEVLARLPQAQVPNGDRLVAAVWAAITTV